MAATKTSASDAPAKKRGDIVSEYLYLVIPFACVQAASWTLSLLQTFGIMGRTAWAASDAMTPIDISFCQMMFWGTLHYGPISDSRLQIVCRMAFLVVMPRGLKP